MKKKNKKNKNKKKKKKKKKKKRHMIKNTYIGLHVKYRLFLSVIKKDLQLSRQIFEKYSTMKFHENPPVLAELFHADGRTDGRTDRQT